MNHLLMYDQRYSLQRSELPIPFSPNQLSIVTCDITLTDLVDDEGMFFATISQSLYTQCLPCSSVHLGFTNAATHYFSSM